MGDNIFLHGAGRFAHIIMTNFGSDSPEKARQWKKLTLREASRLEEPFFEKLNGQPYLSLVISDKGDGIYETLREAYSEDLVISDKKEKPKENDILEYAFLYHSSSRSIDERIGSIRKVISGEVKEFPPPTGLFRMKEIARLFRGFLYLRSGSSIMCYDFYTDPYRNEPITNVQVKGLGKLTDIGGTQYKIYFPVRVPKVMSHVSLFPSASVNQPSCSPQYSYLSMKSFFNRETIDSLEKESTGLYAAFQAIDKFKYENRGELKGLIIDFSDALISQNSLYYLLLETIQRETLDHINICINLDRSAIQQQNALSLFKNVSFIRPITLYDKAYSPQLFCVTLIESDLYSKLLGHDTQTKEMVSFAKNNPQLFRYDSRSERYEFLHSRLRIIQQTRKAITKELQNFILDPSSEIYHKDLKVLIPSGRYSVGYFETFKLLSNENWEFLIQTWFRYWLLELNPDFIISISGHCGRVVDKVLDDLKSIGALSIKHFNLRTPIHDIDFIKLVLGIEKDKSVVIFTDVIGTANTVIS